jgi:hypothetical protein
MYIFVDESGVHKQEGHSSVALVYVAVANIMSFDESVEILEASLGILNFHWSKYS